MQSYSGSLKQNFKFKERPEIQQQQNCHGQSKYFNGPLIEDFQFLKREGVVQNDNSPYTSLMVSEFASGFHFS